MNCATVIPHLLRRGTSVDHDFCILGYTSDIGNAISLMPPPNAAAARRCRCRCLASNEDWCGETVDLLNHGCSAQIKAILRRAVEAMLSSQGRIGHPDACHKHRLIRSKACVTRSSIKLCSYSISRKFGRALSADVSSHRRQRHISCKVFASQTIVSGENI